MMSRQLITSAHNSNKTTMSHPHYLRTRARLNGLINQYLSIEQLSDRLSDLPSQFETPHQRHWEPIHWHAIDRSQVIDVDLELFLKVIASAAEVEAPIRAYAKESWDYFHALHPQMATFMGGTFAEDGSTSPLAFGKRRTATCASLSQALPAIDD